MKQILYLILCLLPLEAFSQEWLGHMTDNYAGLSAVQVQPASIVNTPYKYDISILGARVSGFNMNLFESVGNVSSDEPLTFNDEGSDFLIRGTVLLPSILYKLNDRSAIAFHTNFYANIYTESSDKDLLRLLLNDFDVPDLFGTSFEDEFFTARTHAWWEFGLTYGHELYANENHRLNGALTLSLMKGSVAGFINFEDLSFTLINEDSLLNVSGSGASGYNDELDNFTLDDEKVDLFNTSGFGTSFGLEYMYFVDPDQYKLKLGFSVFDIGKINYTVSENSGEFILDDNMVTINTFREPESLNALTETFDEQFVTQVPESDQFPMNLPTRIGIQADYHIKDKYFINFSNYIALRGDRRRVDETKNSSTIILTPRMEQAKWGLSLPFVYSSVVGFASGFSFRYGPAYIGSSNLFRSIFKEITSVNLFVGFRVTKLWGKGKKRNKANESEIEG